MVALLLVSHGIFLNTLLPRHVWLWLGLIGVTMPHQDKQAITLFFLFAVCEGFRDEEGSKWQGEGYQFVSVYFRGNSNGIATDSLPTSYLWKYLNAKIYYECFFFWSSRQHRRLEQFISTNAHRHIMSIVSFINSLPQCCLCEFVGTDCSIKQKCTVNATYTVITVDLSSVKQNSFLHNVPMHLEFKWISTCLPILNYGIVITVRTK
jgi:hypothetical protein